MVWPAGAVHPRQRYGLRCAVRVVVLVVTALGAAFVTSSTASAHAALDRSSPGANAIVSTAPERVQLWFTEPLERTYTGAELYDSTGQPVPGATFHFDDQNRYAASLSLPPALQNGTYSVVWRTLSAADGHRAQGYFAFTIGTAADVRTFIPPVAAASSGPPEWLRAVSRWLALLGLALAVAVWPVWLLVLRPAISPAWQAGPRLTRRTKRLAAAGIGLGIAGSAVALVVQAAGSDQDDLVSAILTTLSETRYGRLWLYRVALFLALALVLSVAAWWWPKRRRWTVALGLLISGVLPVPYSMLSHAAAQASGRTTAIAFDAVHLLAASLWVGGLIVLAGTLLPALGDLTPAGRRLVLSRAIPRFSVLALTAWGALIITGAYAAWLHVGNWAALRETAYGRSLSVKVLLLIPLLLLAAFHLLVVSRRLERAAGDEAASAWSRRFALAVSAEAAIVVVLLLVVGRMIGQPPAREQLAQEAGVTRVAVDLQGRRATLAVAPGVPGPNHYRLEVDGDLLPPKTEALLRLTLPTDQSIRKEVVLERVPGNAFEGHGIELSIRGDWSVQVIVRLVGSFTYSGQTALSVADVPTGPSLPGSPWRFGTAGVVGLLLLAGGIGLLALAWHAGRTPLRRESAGLGAITIALGAVLLLQARVGEVTATVDILASNPIPADDLSLAKGQAIYQANCLVCHGPAGRGDGPGAATIDPPYPPPADFSTAHARAHYDGEFFNWIKFGKPPTAMPGFGDRLTDEDIWHVINYLRWLQDHPGESLPASDVVSGAGSPASPTAPATPAAAP